MDDETDDEATIDPRITEALKRGPAGLDTLWPLLYEELRRRARNRMRRERPDHTLDPTGLLHEVYLRLARQASVSFDSRERFFAYAATVMRNVLVDHARAKNAQDRWGHQQRVTLDFAERLAAKPITFDVLAVHEALSRLEPHDPFLVRLVELRFFCGFTERETAEILGMPRTEVQEKWRVGKPMLVALLREQEKE
jgi:RNA polymerase sigma-70 factor, ECF subfamily